MGICASCLGLRRRESDDPENTRLLYNDDPFQTNYGALHNAPNGGLQPDSQTKREREILLKATQRATDSVVDIFASETPHPSLHDYNKSSKPVYYHSSLRGVFTPEEMKKKRSSILNGEAHAAKPDIDEDFGTVKRSQQGKLVSQISLD